MCVLMEAAMNMRLRENRSAATEKGNSTRMSTAAKLREMLFRAREYDRKLKAAGDDESKKPAFDMKLNALLPVVRGEMPLKAHAHQADDLFTAVRIAKEFGVKLTLEHVTGRPPETRTSWRRKTSAAVGPTLGHATKFELRNRAGPRRAYCKRQMVSPSSTTRP
jgi:imidazolonepropionase-like amidohydrolase